MKAVGIMAPGLIEIIDLPDPQINEYECLVAIRACGFCNCTDVESVYNNHLHKNMPFPHVQGHEGVGEIMRVGSRVESFAVGDRIVFPEGRIDPSSGVYMCGCGHFAEYAVVRDVARLKADGVAYDSPFADWPRKFPKEIDYVDAAVITPIRETLSGVRGFNIGRGSRVIIYGDGPSGFGLALFAKMEGADYVGVAGHHPKRLEHILRDAGADEVYDDRQTDIAEVARRVRPDIVIDGVGRQDIIIAASHMVTPGGRVGLYAGLHKDNKMLDLHAFADNVSLHKRYLPYGDREVHGEAMELITSGRVCPRDFYSHVMPFTDFNRALELTVSREAFKVVLTF